MLVPSLCLMLLCAGFAPGQDAPDGPDGATAVARPVVRALATPAAEGSHLPNLALGGDGELYLSWVEDAGEGRTRLRFSRLSDDGWSKARTIASGDDWFVNWADFPSLAALTDGTLIAHWLGRLGMGTYAYGVRLRVSTDGGRTWGVEFSPHSDRSATEHGFASIVPVDDRRFRVVWLDGREMAGGHGAGHGHGSDATGGTDTPDSLAEPGAMTLRTALVDRSGKVTDERRLDDRTCECCSTAAVRLGTSVVVAYRDRSADEVRDISCVAVPDAGPVDAPRALAVDGWKQEGCPVNGPALAVRPPAPPTASHDPDVSDEGSAIRPAAATVAPALAAAWYTEAGGRPQVRFATAAEEGLAFSEPRTIDDGNPIGRVDIAAHPRGGWIVTWIERGDAGGEIRVRVIDADGTARPSTLVARTSTERSAGFPRIETRGERVIVAWTETRAESGARAYPIGIRTAELVYPETVADPTD